MKRLIVILLSGLLLWPKAGRSQERYNLNDLLKSAVENSHEIKKAVLQQLESGSKTKEAIANGLPQIEGSLGYTRYGIPDISIPEDMAASAPGETGSLLSGLSDINALHMSSAGVTLSQLLYSQSYLTGIKQARATEGLHDILLQKTEDDIMNEVASNYYQVLMNYSNLNVLDKNIGNLQKLHDILKLQYDNDFVKQTDVSRVKVEMTNLKTQRQTLSNGIQIQERILKIISGIPLEEKMVLDTTIIRDMEFQKPVVSDFLLDVLPEYQLLKKQTELADLEIRSNKAAFYPTLSAYGQFSYSNYDTEFKFNDFNNGNVIGVNATIPIFSSGMRKQKVKQSQLKLQQHQEDFDLAKKQLETGYQNAVNSLYSAWSNLNDQGGNKILANEVYEQVKLQYDEGMASLTDLLNVESSLLEAENLFNQQLLRYKLAEIELLKATGNLKSLIKI